MPWPGRKNRNYSRLPSPPGGSDGREAPIELKELLGHCRETEPFSALARPAPHFLSGSHIQASEPFGKRSDVQGVDHEAVLALLDHLGRAALRRGDDRQAAGHRFERRVRK